ncbi:MAG: sensor histidine kinase [Marmoricola sp.]|nr:sensor histidine kinase [Marmoricola sp.]
MEPGPPPADPPSAATAEADLRAAEQRLARATERYRSLFDNNPHAAFSVDLEGRFTDANVVTQALSGYDLEELRGLSFTALLLDDDVPGAVTVFLGALERKPQQHVASMRTRDGRVMEISIAAVPVIVDDEVIGVDAVAEDITEQNQLRRDLEEARRTAEEADSAKSMFLANMSHEVRTPLTSVLGATEMLGEGDLDDQQKRLVGIIQRSGERLLRLVSDILDVSRLEAGKLAVHHAPFTFAGIVGDLLAWAEPLGRREGLVLRHEIDPRLPETVVGDAVRVSQVLTNLVGNAMKFTDEGEVRLRVDGLGERPDGVMAVRFSVTDTGIGIDPARLASLFDSFTQVDSTQTRRHEGAGLGLAICKELVALMGGELQAESTPGSGSTFAFVLPLAPVGR